ncbi:RsfA family transcriptional regulator [Paenibacillus sp. NPDC056579]|uniref:RsfA family transcriptional regulator n=1 Tax=Paenibacillus sp. NPDC056579 TaxID=3345871 RepID=UPI0036A203A3
MEQERKDNWSNNDDVILAELVLKHIREGSTQLNAFEEAGNNLIRTSAACGFRWNSYVRKQYEKEIREAKQDRMNRKQQKMHLSKHDTVTVSSVTEKDPEQLTQYLEQIIELANKQKMQLSNMVKEITRLKEQLRDKESEISQLKDQLKVTSGTPSEFTVNEDYRTLLQILQRARQIGAIEGEDREKTVFKMDASGNIDFLR